MSSTVQTIINTAYGKIGVTEAEQNPDTNEQARGLRAVKSYLQHLINSGTFGSLTDIIPSVTSYDAGENERVIVDGTITVNLPTTVPLDYLDTSYGMQVYQVDNNYVRPPTDLSVISVVDTSKALTDSTRVLDYIYDNRVRAWIEINALAATDICPLSHRDEDGLSAAIAVRLASDFGMTPDDLVMSTAARFEESLTSNWSQDGEFIDRVDYW